MKRSGFLADLVIPVASILIGGAVAFMFFSSSKEYKLLDRRLTEFRNLEDQEQKLVKSSFAEFSLQTEDRKRELIALHTAVQKYPDLKLGLERYFAWWSSLSQPEWDSFPEMNREQQISFARAGITKPTETEKTIVVDFADWGQTALRPLHLTIDECRQIITDSLDGTQLSPEITEELQQLELPEHRSLALSLWLFEQFRNNPDREALAAQSNRILQAVLADASDETWKNEFQQIVRDNADRSFIKFWIFRNLLVIFDQSTMTLGNRLTKQFPVSDAEIVTAFVNLNDKSRQHSLMVMPSGEARTRLEFLAQSSRPQTPEQKLLVKFIAFTRDRQQVIGAITFGLGNRLPQFDNGKPPSKPQDRPQ
jgi:hypothetical protein